MIDLGMAQTPMFGDGTPDGWATALPGYRGGRVLVDAAFAPTFHAGGELLVGVAWVLVALAAVVAVLTRSIGGPSVAMARR